MPPTSGRTVSVKEGLSVNPWSPSLVFGTVTGFTFPPLSGVPEMQFGEVRSPGLSWGQGVVTVVTGD